MIAETGSHPCPTGLHDGTRPKHHYKTETADAGSGAECPLIATHGSHLAVETRITLTQA